MWILDLEGRALKRLTFNRGSNGLRLWMPDGHRIVFSLRDANGVLNVYAQQADGTGMPEPITSNHLPRWPSSVMPDGTRVFGFALGPTKPTEVVAILLDRAPDGTAVGVARDMSVREESLFRGEWPEISPDGRYLAYESEESGQPEVYVRAFPNVQSGPWQISTGGGTRPAWGRNGSELFFLDRANAMMAVPVQTSGRTLMVGTPVKLFDGSYAEPNRARHYDVSPDGRRFLMIKQANGIPVPQPPASSSS